MTTKSLNSPPHVGNFHRRTCSWRRACGTATKTEWQPMEPWVLALPPPPTGFLTSRMRHNEKKNQRVSVAFIDHDPWASATTDLRRSHRVRRPLSSCLLPASRLTVYVTSANTVSMKDTLIGSKGFLSHSRLAKLQCWRFFSFTGSL